MRIAFDAKRAFHNRRGLGNYSRDVIRLLTTFSPKNDYLLFGVPNPDYTFPNTQTISPDGCWRLLPSLWRSHGCLKQMQTVDVYHGLSGELPFGIHRLPLRKVVTIHDAIFIRYPELYSWTYRHLFAHKVQYACNAADTIIAISEQTKRDIIEFFHADEKKIEVVYQGCSHIFRESVSDEQIAEVKSLYGLPSEYLLQVGAIEPRKNLHNLISAVALAHIDLPIVSVGGRTRYADEAERLASQLGVRLLCISGANFRHFPAIYKGATVFCYPSLFEGFGIPILEAMCVGVPVLTSTGSCFSETGGNAALYANPLDTEEIADQLSLIVSDGELQEQMRRKGKQQAALFTDERVALALRRVVLKEEV
ncbi:MAG: glycosyltransferase family 4 protein [Paludibacteraceae bacterium]|nr:glycosyltransferase family 4 protein [Paludibacteraceae bacterium]